MRLKIIFPNIIIVLFLGFASYFLLVSDFRKHFDQKTADKLTQQRGLFEQTKRLRGYDMLNVVIKRGRSRELSNVFKPIEDETKTDDEIRQILYRRAFTEVETFSEYWKEEYGRKPELVIITEHNGVAIARNTSPGACPAGKNIAKSLPEVAKALDGQARRFIWSVTKSPFAPGKADADACEMMGGSLLDAVIAPIWRGDEVVGSFLVGFDLSKGLAQEDAERIGLDVAYMEGSDVYSSSLKTDVERKELGEQIKGPLADEVKKALAGRKATGIVSFSTSMSNYFGIVAPLPGVQESSINYMLFASIDDARKPLDGFSVIFILMCIAAILVIITGWILGNHFINPVVQIEEGLLRVINGDFKYRFEVRSAEVGGLCYRINQLIGVLTGEEEEEEEEEEESETE